MLSLSALILAVVSFVSNDGQKTARTQTPLILLDSWVKSFDEFKKKAGRDPISFKELMTYIQMDMKNEDPAKRIYNEYMEPSKIIITGENSKLLKVEYKSILPFENKRWCFYKFSDPSQYNEPNNYYSHFYVRGFCHQPLSLFGNTSTEVSRGLTKKEVEDAISSQSAGK